MSSRPASIHVFVLALKKTTLSGTVSFAGCLSIQSPGDSDASPSDTETTIESTSMSVDPSEWPPSSETTAARASTCDGTWLSFWGLTEKLRRLWELDLIRLGYTAGPGKAWLVVYENDTVLGVEQATTGGEHGITVDEGSLRLDAPLSGEHTIRVVMYLDGDSTEFDPATATPCRDGGDPVQAGPKTIDFSEFEDWPTGAPTTRDG